MPVDRNKEGTGAGSKTELRLPSLLGGATAEIGSVLQRPMC